MSHQPNYEVVDTTRDMSTEVGSIRMARDISRCINDGQWKEELHLVEKAPTYIQYHVTPNDVLRYEDLFDMELTERLGVLLTNEESTLGKMVLDRVQQAIVYQGELTTEETHTILTDMDESDLMEGISLRKINIEMIRNILTL